MREISSTHMKLSACRLLKSKHCNYLCLHRALPLLLLLQCVLVIRSSCSRYGNRVVVSISDSCIKHIGKTSICVLSSDKFDVVLASKKWSNRMQISGSKQKRMETIRLPRMCNDEYALDELGTLWQTKSHSAGIGWNRIREICVCWWFAAQSVSWIKRKSFVTYWKRDWLISTRKNISINAWNPALCHISMILIV